MVEDEILPASENSTLNPYVAFSPQPRPGHAALRAIRQPLIGRSVELAVVRPDPWRLRIPGPHEHRAGRRAAVTNRRLFSTPRARIRQ